MHVVSRELVFSEFKTFESSKYVGQPPTGMKGTDDFDTVWQVFFTLSPDVNIVKEIWLVQDESEVRTTTNLLGVHYTPSGIVVMDEKLNLLELVAWCGGMWFFLTQVVFGPIVRNFFIDKKRVAIISEEEFNRKETEFIEIIDTARKSSASDLGNLETDRNERNDE
jgi:hypothetical protein